VPTDVRRLYNISGSFTGSGDFLQGPPRQWVEELTELAITEGIGTFILGSDDPEMITTFAAEVAPAVRDAVADERARPAIDHDHPVPVAAPCDRRGPGNFTVTPTPDDGSRLSPVPLWDEKERPAGPSPDPDRQYSPAELAASQQLVDIHDHLRAELTQVRDLIGQVLGGSIGPGSARFRDQRDDDAAEQLDRRGLLRGLLPRSHHPSRDRGPGALPPVAQRRSAACPVVDRLASEHVVIHEVLDSMDRALVAFVADPASGNQLRRAADELSDTLLSHLSYEERELVEPLARLRVLG
jgi:hypothetical protein